MRTNSSVMVYPSIQVRQIFKTTVAGYKDEQVVEGIYKSKCQSIVSERIVTAPDYNKLHQISYDHSILEAYI